LEQDTIGKSIFEVFPFLNEKVREEYLKVFEDGNPLITVETNRLGNIEFITETRKIPIIEESKVIRVVTVVHDISERKRAEVELRASEERYRRLLDSVTDYIYSVKLESGQLLATIHGPGCLAVTGYTSEEYMLILIFGIKWYTTKINKRSKTLE